MKFGSVCSGIEAASVAWEPLGWAAEWFSEIEAFPSAVLSHHYPKVMNHGDMTKLASKVANDNIPAPDVLVGGTPCQAFSIAGKRGSLSDDRGALTLSFVELADAIDDVRHDRGDDACIVAWENVPGCLSTHDNAFGCFLGKLAGDSVALEPGPKPEPGKQSAFWGWSKKERIHYPRWPKSGAVAGPRRAIAWRTLDAQYFGVAQRRRRVFLVASARNGFDPTEVLFEREGVRRDTAPSREAGEEVAGILESRTGAGGFPGTDGSCSGHVVPVHGCWWDGGQVTQTLDAVLHKGQTMPEKNRFPAVLQPVCVTGDITHALNTADNGKGCGEDGTGRGVPTIAFPTEMSGTQVASTFNLCPSLSVKHTLSVVLDWLVRRLTPTECERLQGFPDGHTDVPFKRKPAADGPRYKAIGNSMAVPVMRWIGKRIQNYANDNNQGHQ